MLPPLMRIMEVIMRGAKLYQKKTTPAGGQPISILKAVRCLFANNSQKCELFILLLLYLHQIINLRL